VVAAENLQDRLVAMPDEVVPNRPDDGLDFIDEINQSRMAKISRLSSRRIDCGSACYSARLLEFAFGEAI